MNNIAILLERIGRVLQNDAHTHGLKPTQWEALRYLGRANRFSRSPSAVTAYLGMTKGTVSQTLAALERKGLIEKSSDPTDKRNIHINLTGAGGELLQEDPVRQFVQPQDKISAELEAGLEKLLLDTLEKRGGKAFGACKTCKYFQVEHTDFPEHGCGLLKVALSSDDADRICAEHIH